MKETPANGVATRVAVIVAVAAFGLYAWTAAPDVALVDSAELVLAASTGGVAHPPGVPLYLLIGGAFSLLPLGSEARTLNLLSAGLMAMSAGALFLAADRMLALLGAEGGRRHVAALTAALAFATSYNPWTWSSVAEVYALNVLLLTGTWVCAWTAADRLTGSRGAVSVSTWRWITAGTVLAALGLANHHASAALAFPVLLVMLLLLRPQVLRMARIWVTAVLSVAGSLSLYLYLFLAARKDQVLNWGGIDSLWMLWRHVIGVQYSEQVGSVPGETTRVASEFGDTLVLGGGLPAAILAVAGLVALFAGAVTVRSSSPRRDASRFRAVLGALFAMIALNLVLSLNYVAGPEDRMAYDLPAATAWALLAAVGAWVVSKRAPAAGAGGVAVCGLLVAIPTVWNVARNLELCNLHEERVARTFVEETLGDLEEGAVVLTAEWNLYAPYLYLRHLEGWRTDLRIVDVLMLRRFWYLDYLERAMPELIETSRFEYDRFRRELVKFDLGQPYDQANIQTWYDELILAWIREGQARGGAFADWGTRDHPQEQSWLAKSAALPDELLIRFPGPQDASLPSAVSPKNVENLLRVRSRLTDASIDGDRLSLVPRHDPYFRVWRSYQSAVESTLLLGARYDASLPGRWMDGYQDWFPETGRVARRVGLP